MVDYFCKVYLVAIFLNVVIVITVSNFGADVLCSDENLFVALSNPTTYCEIYGEFFICELAL